MFDTLLCKNIIENRKTDRLQFFHFEMPLIVRYMPFSRYSARLIFLISRIHQKIAILNFAKKYKKQFNLLAIRTNASDGYGASKSAAMIFQTGGTFSLNCSIQSLIA